MAKNKTVRWWWPKFLFLSLSSFFHTPGPFWDIPHGREGGGKSAQWEIHGGDFFLFENSNGVITADRVPNIRIYIEVESQIRLGIRSESSIQGRGGNPTLSELVRFQGDRTQNPYFTFFITIFLLIRDLRARGETLFACYSNPLQVPLFPFLIAGPCISLPFFFSLSLPRLINNPYSDDSQPRQGRVSGSHFTGKGTLASRQFFSTEI